jgi:hypothetical protein
MTTEMCANGKVLRVNWLYSPALERPILKGAYEDHLRICPQCRAHFAELTEAAEKAEYPEVTDETE